MKYLTPKQHLRRLRFERLVTYLKYVGLSVIFGIAIFIIYICLTSDNDTKKMNECLQDHELNYCNRIIK